jgi:glycosyltransferase involved in cell wall biosynthesis
MNNDPWGGSEVQWFELAKHLILKGEKVTCLMYKWEEKDLRLNELRQLGVSIIDIPNYGRKKENLIQRLAFEWITRIQQKFFIENFNFSIYDYAFVNQGGFMEVTNSPWKHLYKRLKKYCLTFHNYTPNYVFKNKKKGLLKCWINNAHINVAAAYRIKDVLQNQLNIKFNNFYALENPLTMKRKKTYTNFPDLVNGNFKMIMLAQLDVSRKAQDNLIRVFINEKWRRRNLIVELFGSGNDFALLNKLIIDNNLDKQIFLKGNTSNVEIELSNAHLYLQITHRDALPLSIIEAMNVSRAIVVSNIGDMPLWVSNGKSGFIANDATVEEIDLVLELAWQKRNDWEKMGQNSFDIFNTKFPENVSLEFEKLILK